MKLKMLANNRENSYFKNLLISKDVSTYKFVHRHTTRKKAEGEHFATDIPIIYMASCPKFGHPALTSDF